MTQKWVRMSEALATAGTTAKVATVEEFLSADESVEEANEVLSAQHNNACGFLVSNWKSWYSIYKSSD